MNLTKIINSDYAQTYPTLKQPVQKLLATGFNRIINYRYEEVELDAESIYYNVMGNIPSNDSIKKYAIVISDTHDDMKYIQTIIETANRLGIRNIFHAGDVVNDQALAEFRNFRGKFSVSFGNHDKTSEKKKELNRICNKFKFNHECGHIRLISNHKTVVLTHGNDPKLINELIFDHDFNFLIIGHYHRRILLHNPTTNKYVINPGAFNNEPLPIEPINNIPSFVLLPIHTNNPHDIIFYHIISHQLQQKKAKKANEEQQEEREQQVLFEGILS